MARRRLRCCGHRSKGHDNKLLPNFESCEPRSRELGSGAARTSSTEKKTSTRPVAELKYGCGYLLIRCKCTTFLSVSDKNERKYVSCRTYSVRMCFEVVVFGLCAVRNGVKAPRKSAPTRGLRLTNWQLLSDECGRELGNRGNCLRTRVGEGGNAPLSAACGGKGGKSGRLTSESRLIFGKTSGLSLKSPRFFRTDRAKRIAVGGWCAQRAEEAGELSSFVWRNKAKPPLCCVGRQERGGVAKHLSLGARGT